MKFEEGQVEFEDKVLFEELIKDTNSILEKYNQILIEESVEEEDNETADEMEKIVEEVIAEIVNESITEEVSEDTPSDVNFNQDLKEGLDEIININKEKGEGEGMAIENKLDEKEVAVEEVVETPANFEVQEDNKEEKVENEAEVMEEAAEEPAEEEKVEEACKKMEEDDKEEDDKEDIQEEEMSKADKKTYEARIATLEQNIKTLKSELKAAEPYKALYEESLSKVKELEAYKEDVELDKLRTDKVKYAQTCNFDALEDEDKEVVQEKIDDYKFSLYDFKAFMADVLKKYSRKQVYSNMEKIISYFSVEETRKVEDEMGMPSDKNMADRILDKYSDAL